MIYVGTCGFSYKDWVGPFYPPKTKPSEMLRLYARSFPAVEIDSSYYGVPSPRSVESMAVRTPPQFRFSFKAPQTVTHPSGELRRVHEDAAALLTSLEPAIAARKLACVLVQFPNAFVPGRAGEEYLRRVVESLSAVAVVVEFRNRRWQCPETIDLLAELSASYANVDMPHLEGLLEPSSDATGPIGYVRFHGRNAKTWWRGSNVTRYDYLYALEELAPWADRIAEVDAQTRDTYVFFNNHANGRAPRNAEMIAGLLEQRYGRDAARALAPVGTLSPAQTRLPGIASTNEDSP